MKLKRIIQKNNVAVSSVIAVILMVSITVGLASGAYLMLSSINNEPNPIPDVTLLQCQSTTNPAINTLTFVSSDQCLYWEDIGFSIHYSNGEVANIFDHDAFGPIKTGDLIDIGGNDGVLNLELGDGVMRVVIIHTRTNSMIAEFDFTEASGSSSTTVDPSNNPPVVTGILDQTIAEGSIFATIRLDDYVSDLDNDEMTWTYSGNTDLTVSIVDRVATITIPGSEWNGAETITFRATDPGLLWDEDAATFTVTGVNDPPVVTDIPDQTIGEGSVFATISLDDYVSDLDNGDDEMTWVASGNVELTVDIVDRVATITVPGSEWSGVETITFRATDPDLSYDEDDAVFTVQASSGGCVAWNRTFGGDDADLFASAMQTSDGGYIMTGEIWSFGHDWGDVWLLKTYPNGTEEWNRTFGTGGGEIMEHECGNSVKQTSDGGYIITGRTESFSPEPGNWDAWLIKTDSTGHEEWNRTFGGSDHDVGLSVVETSDEGYIVLGSINGSVSLFKTNDTGHKIWERTFGRTGVYNWSKSLAETSDGGYIFTGLINGTFGTNNGDIWLVKTNSTGHELWDRTFGALEDEYRDEGRSVVETSDGGFIITGSAYNDLDENGNAYVCLIKTDSTGHEEWYRTFDGAYWGGYSVIETSNGDFLIAGDTDTYGNAIQPYKPDLWLIKTNSMGQELWNKTYGGLEKDRACSVMETSDGDYVIAGYTKSYGAGWYDGWLIKTDSDGNELCE